MWFDALKGSRLKIFMIEIASTQKKKKKSGLGFLIFHLKPIIL